MDVILGIDTSCYTTSVAVADIEKSECRKYELSMLLPEKGEKGLRQSTALFFHIKNLPEVTKRLFDGEDFNIKGVAVSAKPRPCEGSYMPVFEGGIMMAKTLASAMNVPCFETTHQENHIEAASEGKFSDRFFALHLSGGTTELLDVRPHATGYDIELKSATTDISFGKLIDRIGVLMGLEFPCGKELEVLAANGKPSFMPKPKLYNGAISLSGAEKQFSDALEKYSKEDIAAGLFRYTGELLALWVSTNVDKDNDVLFAGGVSSNKIIRKILTESKMLAGRRLHFAEPELCRDNAVGTSLLGVKKYKAWQEENGND